MRLTVIIIVDGLLLCSVIVVMLLGLFSDVSERFSCTRRILIYLFLLSLRPYQINICKNENVPDSVEGSTGI